MSYPDFFEVKHEIVLEEWKAASSNIGRLDSLVFTIRSWAITITTAVITYAYTKSDPAPCLFVMAPLLSLWFMDAMFKAFQRVFIDRSKEIETYLASEKFEADHKAREMNFFEAPKLASRFGNGTSAERLKAVVQQGFLRNVLITYWMLICFCLLAYWWL